MEYVSKEPLCIPPSQVTYTKWDHAQSGTVGHLLDKTLQSLEGDMHGILMQHIPALYPPELDDGVSAS